MEMLPSHATRGPLRRRATRDWLAPRVRPMTRSICMNGTWVGKRERRRCQRSVGVVVPMRHSVAKWSPHAILLAGATGCLPSVRDSLSRLPLPREEDAWCVNWKPSMSINEHLPPPSSLLPPPQTLPPRLSNYFRPPLFSFQALFSSPTW